MYDSIGSWLAALAPEAPKAVERQLVGTLRLWLIMLALHIPVYFFWGWLLFRRWDDFWDALKLGWWCWYGEDWWDNAYAEAKVALWFFAPIGLIGFEMRLLGW